MSTASSATSVQKQTPPSGFTLTELVISGQDREDASVTFKPGLNVVVGASDAGKSHILEQIDHVLGSSSTPERFPENEGYTTTFVGVRSRGDGAEVTLRRSMDGGGVLLYEAAPSAIEGIASSRILNPTHDAGSPDNISAFLLELVGLNKRRLRKNKLGETVSLTFRFLAHLCFVAEGEMFRRESPALSSNYVQNTQEKAAFSLLLTGRDDGTLVAAVSPTIKKTQLLAQIEIIGDLITDRQTKLRQLGKDGDDATAELQRVDESIAVATRTLASITTEMTQIESSRRTTFAALRPVESRLAVLHELLARFDLLAGHYQSDVGRLAAMIEAGRRFESLDEATCPLCDSPLSREGDGLPSAADFEAFADACEAEIKKIEALQSDLDSTRSRMAEEQAELVERSLSLDETITAMNRRLAEVLEPQSRTSESELNELMAARSKRSLAFALAEELRDLQTRVGSLVAQSKVKQAKQPKAEFNLRPFDSFALVVEGLLREWQYPNLQRVTFDQQGFDIVVSGRSRGGRGKGFRAVTHAAFTIGLMRYCRQHGLPHPGVVILDSPLVTLKEPKPGAPAQPPPTPTGDSSPDAAEEIPLSMKDAFYRSLANEPNGDQIIIIENDDPPQEVEDVANIIRFTGIEGCRPVRSLPAKTEGLAQYSSGQQHRRCRSVGLGDDPDLHAVCQQVRGQEPAAFLHCPVIESLVLGSKVAPVPAGMTVEKFKDIRPGGSQSLKSGGSSNRHGQDG